MRCRHRMCRSAALAAIGLVALMLTAAGEGIAADPAGSDEHVLHELFGEAFLADNVLEVRRQAAGLVGEQKYRYLLQWVMPGLRHPELRLTGDFTPNDPAPVTHFAQATQSRGELSSTGRDARISRGGELVSPALDLVDMAQQLKCLDQLASQVQQLVASDRSQRRAQRALLFLIHAARQDDEAATSAFENLFDLFSQSDHVEVADRWPETIALARAVDYPSTRSLAGELLYVLYDMYTSNQRGWRTRGTQNWDHWFFSVFGLHKHLQAGGSLEQFFSPPPLNNWVPASYSTSMTRGKGLPRSHWQWTGQQLFNLSGHAKDYLYYRIPLLGEYEVECELTLGAWRSTEILVAGTWVSPQWSRNACSVGNARDQGPRHTLDPPLTEFDEWVHYRAVVRKRACTVYINGRVVHHESLPDDPDPWLAIRSEARSHGGLRNLRITGQPVVPAKISLTSQPHLPGWIPYQAYGLGPQAAWDYAGEFSPSGGIIGRLSPALSGANQEGLIRYHRPMLEDGAIEYEFFYNAGKLEVHPALDRLAFVLETGGVHLHWITDGEYDRTGLEPDNRSVEPQNRRGSTPLPLRNADWNHLRLSLRGDIVRLELNGKPIYELTLEPTNGRTFGLFHYRDQSAAKVRNVVWSGAWPRQVPLVEKQELALPDHESLAGLDQLQEVFSHDFATNGVPMKLFKNTVPNQETLVLHSNGLRVVVENREAFPRVEYRSPIYGDFDATLEFANLKLSHAGRGVIGLELAAVDDSGIVVGSARLHREKNRISATAKMAVPLPDNTRRYAAIHLADESQQGTLRLVRRGGMVHSLIAHGDSSYFRYLGAHRLPSAGTAMQIRPQVYTVAGGTAVDVLLKKLTIRSSSSQTLERIDPRVASLNQYTLGLPSKYRHSFATAGDTDFFTSGKPHVATVEDGLHLRSRANPATEITSVAWQRGGKEDFDIATSFDLLRLPDKGTLAFSLTIEGSEPTTARLTASRLGVGKLHVAAGINGAKLEIPTVEVDSLDGLRIARIQRTLMFMYAESGFFRLLGMTDVGSGDLKPGSVQFLAGGSASPPVEVLLKSWEVRATALKNQ